MIPKDKARQLVNKMWIHALPNENGSWKNAKQCALIAVNEIIQNFFSNFDYWEEVKQEIEKL